MWVADLSDSHAVAPWFAWGISFKSPGLHCLATEEFAKRIGERIQDELKWATLGSEGAMEVQSRTIIDAVWSQLEQQLLSETTELSSAATAEMDALLLGRLQAQMPEAEGGLAKLPTALLAMS
jgi:hypothetical protein